MMDNWQERGKKRFVHSARSFVVGLAMTIAGMYLWLPCRVMWIGITGCVMAMVIGPLIIWGSIDNAWEAWGDYRWERDRHACWESHKET